MMDPRKITIAEYNYDLPDERIAKHPLKERDASKLLVYQNGDIREKHFRDIVDFLPEDALLVYNETKVVQARIPFFKTTGARIEVFCLEPVEPTREIQTAFDQKGSCIWKCFVGNSKKWKSGQLSIEFEVNGQTASFAAEKMEADGNAYLVKFSWTPEDLSFAEALEGVGKIPLPPYLNREVEKDDLERYQTVFARNKGSVAAPTAGLHFTDDVLSSLEKKKIRRERLTLHVGAGTFKPVSCDAIVDHEMHTEQIVIELSALKNIRTSLNRPIFPVGTTSMRTMESLYWHGKSLLMDREKQNVIDVRQWDPYQETNVECTPAQALDEIIKRCEEDGQEIVQGGTQLMIAPGYQYRIASGIITNFHQPQSTLLLLVSAMVGEDWKKIYEYALENDFRFLSYGDSCLLFKNEE